MHPTQARSSVSVAACLEHLDTCWQSSMLRCSSTADKTGHYEPGKPVARAGTCRRAYAPQLPLPVARLVLQHPVRVCQADTVRSSRSGAPLRREDVAGRLRHERLLLGCVLVGVAVHAVHRRRYRAGEGVEVGRPRGRPLLPGRRGDHACRLRGPPRPPDAGRV